MEIPGNSKVLRGNFTVLAQVSRVQGLRTRLALGGGKGQLIVIEISNMKKGIYYLTVHSDQKLKTLKLVLL